MADQDKEQGVSRDTKPGPMRPGRGRRIFKGVARFLWLLVRKGAYVVFIVVAVCLLLLGLDKAAEFALWKSPMSYVYPEDLALTKKDLTKPASQYDYDLNPRVCLIYNQEKGNRYEYANNAGFRDPRDIPFQKPDDEYRIFLTGGSTAFGLGAAGQSAAQTNNYYLEYRETIAYLLEKILNASDPIPGKTIKVYNTAVWGHAYQHLLLRYVTKLRQYKPDLVVSLDGANEIHPVSVPEKDWNYFNQGQFHGILKEILSYTPDGIGAYLTLWLKNNTFLMAFIWRGMDPFFSMETGLRMHQSGSFGPDHVSGVLGMTIEERSKMVTDNVSSVVRVVEDYHAVLENDGIPHIFALQPMLYLSKKPRHEMEQRVEAFQEHKQYYDVPTDGIYEYICERIRESAQRKQYSLVDFSKYFDDTAQWVFTDWCHVTAGANYLMAKELANVIKEHFLHVSLGQGDKIDSKDSFFAVPSMSAKVVNAPDAIDGNNNPQNMLRGYPGPESYTSKEVGPHEKMEVVLDLNSIQAISRLRLVWNEESFVPSAWAVDISPDGNAWTPWVEGTNKNLDQFSWWPAFDYFGNEPVQARFLRYRQITSENRSIGLRSWNVYR
jgi:hypothetical protein